MPKLDPYKVDSALAKWRVRRDKLIAQLAKAQDQIKRLEKSQRRLANKPMPSKPEASFTSANDAALIEAADEAVDAVVEQAIEQDELEIPSYLKRTALDPTVAAAAYAVANAHNAPPTDEQKKLIAKEKAAVRKEHKHALMTGQLRKEPLTGKAALAAIRGES